MTTNDLPAARRLVIGLALPPLVAASLVAAACETGSDAENAGVPSAEESASALSTAPPPFSEGPPAAIETTESDSAQAYIVQRGSVGDKEVFFIKQRPGSLSAGVSVSGRLIVDQGGCLRLRTFNEQQPPDYLLVWPPEYTLGAEDGEILILDGDGHLKARIGDKISVSGAGLSGATGNISDEQLGRERNVPKECRQGAHWVVGEEVSLVEQG